LDYYKNPQKKFSKPTRNLETHKKTPLNRKKFWLNRKKVWHARKNTQKNPETEKNSETEEKMETDIAKSPKLTIHHYL
jgi:hypothetical protein